MSQQQKGEGRFAGAHRAQVRRAAETITNMRPLSHWLTLGLVIMGIVLRLLFLDADPYYYEWAGYITDEGRWIQYGRSLALHNTLFQRYEYCHNCDSGLHLFLAPLFQLVNYLMFTLAGVSLLTSRLLPSLCGSAILVIFWASLRHTVTPQALLLGMVLLAFQVDLLVLSRVAVPEMVIMFFQLLIYFILVSNRGTSYRMLLAGLLLLIAVGFKVTMAPFLAIFSAMIFFLPRYHTREGSYSQRWRELGLFWTGFGLPAAVAGLIWLSFYPSGWSPNLSFLSTLKGHVALATAYNVLSFPFEHTLTLTLNTWALGLWLLVVGWMAAGRDIDLAARRYLVPALIWCALYLFLMLALKYFPTRYRIHILIPMAVSITVGLSLLQRMGILKVITSFTRIKGLSCLLQLAILSFPTAVFLAPLLASAIALSGADPERLISKLVSLTMASFAMTYLGYCVNRCQQAIGFFLIFPLIGAMAWLIVSSSALNGYSFWPDADVEMHVAWWGLFLLAVAAITIALVKAAGHWRAVGCTRFITIYALCYLTISLVTIAPGYIDPHYSIKDTSRDLGRLLAGAASIGVARAEGLFNDNSLRYSSIGGSTFTERPEILLIAFDVGGEKEILEREYSLMQSYDLYVSPEYYRLHWGAAPTRPKGEIVKVYRRKTEAASGGYR